MSCRLASQPPISMWLLFNRIKDYPEPQLAILPPPLDMWLRRRRTFARWLRSTLSKHGPLWIGTAILYPSIYRHVRILKAPSGDGSFDGNVATLVDSDGGHE